MSNLKHDNHTKKQWILVVLKEPHPLLLYAVSVIARREENGIGLFATVAVALLLFGVFIYLPYSAISTQFCPAQAGMYGLPDTHTVSWLGMLTSWKLPARWFGWPVGALMLGLTASVAQRPSPMFRTTLAFGLMALTLIFFMSDWSRPFWRLSDKFMFIQFPYRMLSVAIPLIFIFLAGVLAGVPAKLREKILIAMLAGSALYAIGIAIHHLRNNPILSADKLRHEVFSLNVEAGGEYFPAAFQAQLAAKEKSEPALVFLPSRRALVEGWNGCTLSTAPARWRFRSLEMRVSCPSGGVVRVNQFATALLEASATNGREIVKPAAGSLVIDFVLPEGEWEILVRRRSYWEMVAWSLQPARWSQKL